MSQALQTDRKWYMGFSWDDLADRFLWNNHFFSFLITCTTSGASVMLVIYHMSLSSDSSDSSLRLLTFSHFEAKWLLPLHLARMALHMGPLPFFFSFLADFRFFLDWSKGLFCRCYLSFAPCASSLCDAEKVLNYEFAASVLLRISMHLFRSSIISWSIRFGVALENNVVGYACAKTSTSVSPSF